MKFEDQEPNFFESDAQAVPVPHHVTSRVAKVEEESRFGRRLAPAGEPVARSVRW